MKISKRNGYLIVATFWLAILTLWSTKTQAQQSNPAYFCCDSINYWTDQGQGLIVGLDTTNMIHNPDSIEIYWSVCNSSTCYSGDSIYDYFPQIMTTDTIKVCYDLYLYEVNSVEVCTRCDSLIFDQNTYSWIMFSMSQPVSINEFIIEKFNNGKMYDLLGREITEIPVGKMYIRNNKKYIRYE